MIRATALADYLSEKTEISRDDFLIDTATTKILSVTQPVQDGPIRISKEYEGTITVVGVEKRRQFTTVQLYIRDWFMVNGYSSENFSLDTEDFGDEKECNIEIRNTFREITQLEPVELEGEELETYIRANWDKLIDYKGVKYQEVEVTRPIGV